MFYVYVYVVCFHWCKNCQFRARFQYNGWTLHWQHDIITRWGKRNVYSALLSEYDVHTWCLIILCLSFSATSHVQSERCGPLLSMFCSLCLSVCWSQPSAMLKRLNQLRCCLGVDSGWPKKQCGSRSPEERGNCREYLVTSMSWSYSIVGSSNAAVSCQYCSNLLCL